MIFLFGIVCGALVVFFVFRNLKMGGRVEPDLIAKQAKEKEENKQKILGLFEKQHEVSNNDVEKLLSVSDRSATRYMEELQREGKVEQIGSTGRSVVYKQKG